MQTTINRNHFRTTPFRRPGLCVAIALATASVGSAGLVGPGGDSHTWTGASDTNWHNAANWTGAAVPADSDAAIVDGGPFNNILLNADSAGLASLFIAGAKAVSTNGFTLRVTNSSGTTTVSGLDSNLFVANAGGGANAFESSVLDLQNQGRLQMSDGIARISEQLTMTSAGRLTGNGLVEISSANVAAFNGFGGSLISANGDLTIRVIGGGGIVLPPLINVLTDNASVTVEGPFFLDDLTDVNLGTNTLLDIESGWNLTGTLNADPGAGFGASVLGGSIGVDGSIDVDSGVLSIGPTVTLRNGSTVNIAASSTLVLNSSHFASAGQSTFVAPSGVLRINGLQVISAWNGDITMTAGRLEANEPQIGSWEMNGDLALGSFLGQRPNLDGSALMSLSGNIMVFSQGVVMNNSVRLEPTAVVQLDQPSTRVTVRETLTQDAGAEISGLGFIEIVEIGTMTVVEPADLNVSVANEGLFRVQGGSEEVGYCYIGGAFTQESTGILEVQIAGPNPVDRDIYETSLAATLAGTITVSLVAPYLPMIGDEFTVFTANGGLVGVFDVLAGDPGFEVSYVGADVVLTYVGVNDCPGDINGDGVVDTADLGILVGQFGTVGPGADLNGDNIVDTADLGILIGMFGTNCP